MVYNFKIQETVVIDRTMNIEIKAETQEQADKLFGQYMTKRKSKTGNKAREFREKNEIKISQDISGKRVFRYMKSFELLSKSKHSVDAYTQVYLTKHGCVIK